MDMYQRISPDVKVGPNTRIFAFVNLYGCTIGHDSKVGAFVEIQKNACIGNNVKVSSHSFICEGVTIDDDVFVGHNVSFINDKYPRSTAEGKLQTEADWKVVTTLPAPTIAFSPIVTPQRMVELVPIEAPLFTSVGTTFQSASVCIPPPGVVERGYLSLMNETLCPTNTSSSIVTPSQMNVWLETFTFLPIFAFFWISTKVPIFEPSPISQP